jgi:hypothetical protein
VAPALAGMESMVCSDRPGCLSSWKTLSWYSGRMLFNRINCKAANWIFASCSWEQGTNATCIVGLPVL